MRVVHFHIFWMFFLFQCRVMESGPAHSCAARLVMSVPFVKRTLKIPLLSSVRLEGYTFVCVVKKMHVYFEYKHH